MSSLLLHRQCRLGLAPAREEVGSTGPRCTRLDTSQWRLCLAMAFQFFSLWKESRPKVRPSALSHTHPSHCNLCSLHWLYQSTTDIQRKSRELTLVPGRLFRRFRYLLLVWVPQSLLECTKGQLGLSYPPNALCLGIP
jgi:hypothetical protein